MDIDMYVEAIMQKLEDSNYYSEIKSEDLRSIIELHLTSKYEDAVSLLSLEMDLKESKGVVKELSFYKDKMSEIKSGLFKIASEISKTSKDD